MVFIWIILVVAGCALLAALFFLLLAVGLFA
jgi:hypothetical protein